MQTLQYSQKEEAAKLYKDIREKRCMGLMTEVIFNLFKKPVTENFPKEKPKVPKKVRGKHRYYQEKCIGCLLCEKACPTDAIKMHVIPGQKGKNSIDIDFGRCIFCGLCVERCPTAALEFTNEFLLATKNKKELLLHYPEK